MTAHSPVSRRQLAALVGQRIRGFREQRRWGREDLAVMLKLPAESIHAYEEGRALPRAYTLYRLAQLFAVPADNLLPTGGTPVQPITDARLYTAVRECQSLPLALRSAVTDLIEYTLEAIRKLRPIRESAVGTRPAHEPLRHDHRRRVTDYSMSSQPVSLGYGDPHRKEAFDWLIDQAFRLPDEGSERDWNAILSLIATCYLIGREQECHTALVSISHERRKANINEMPLAVRSARSKTLSIISDALPFFYKLGIQEMTEIFLLLLSLAVDDATAACCKELATVFVKAIKSDPGVWKLLERDFSPLCRVIEPFLVTVH